MQRHPRRGAAALLALMLAWSGCGGGGDREPGPTTVLTGRVVVDAFTVGADERVACEGAVTIECRTATIAGRLYSLPAADAGSDGNDLTIIATEDLVVTGSVAAGAGRDGGADAPGGDGGDLRLVSTTGRLRLGAAAGRQADEPLPVVAAGDGGDGGDGRWGAAGGDGGQIELECPNGELVLTPQPGLIHPGRGGHGGDGAWHGDAMNGFPAEGDLNLTNRGGDGGRLSFVCDQLTGIELTATDAVNEDRPVMVGSLPAGMVRGGEDGDAGDFYLGVDPATGVASHPRPTDRRQDDPSWRWMRSNIILTGQDGGEGFPTSGTGGSLMVNLNESVPPLPGGDGAMVILEAGAGGMVSPGDTISGTLRTFWVELHGLDVLRPGQGGSALATGGNGGNGAAGGNGGNGGQARARGGRAGWINHVFRTDWEVAASAGGNALASGGHGGRGGDAADDQQLGGNGGEGASASGIGGSGPTLNHQAIGPGGDGRGRGGNGGNGGNSARRPGDGGSYGGGYGSGGEGAPDGAAETINGNPGTPGQLLPPASSRTTFSARIHRGPTATSVDFRPEFFIVHTLPAEHRQLPPALGGLNHPLVLPAGQSMASDGRDFYACSTAGDGIRRYRDRADGGDVPADLTLTVGGAFYPVALWLDHERDSLYAVHRPGGERWSAELLAWDNVSQIATAQPPHRVCTISDSVHGLTSLTGDAARDRLFILDGPTRVGVLDGASRRSGQVAFDRTILGAAQGTTGIAHDPQRDLLFVQRDDPSGAHGLALVTNASTANGTVNPTIVTGPATGLTAPTGQAALNRAVAIFAFGHENWLFVQAAGGQLLTWRDAATLTGDQAAAYGWEVGGGLAALVTAVRE